MNIFFHTSAAIGILALSAQALPAKPGYAQQAALSLLFLCLGVLSHAVLDYIPHCYPIPSVPDVSLGLLIILLHAIFASGKYRFMRLYFPGTGKFIPGLSIADNVVYRREITLP